jgi:hypothetical protein
MEPDPIDSDKVTKAPPKPAAFQHPLARHPYLVPGRDPNRAMLLTVRRPGKESDSADSGMSFGGRVPRVSDLASNGAVDSAVVEPSPGRRPAAPPRHLYRDDRAAGRLPGVLGVLIAQGGQGQGHLAWVVGHPSAAVQPDPPQHRPVLAVLIDEQACAAGRPEVVEPAKLRASLGLVIDRGVDGVFVDREADRDEVRYSIGANGSQMGDSG